MGCFEDVFDVVQELVRLLLKVPVDELPGLWVNAELAGDKDEIASCDALIRDEKSEHTRYSCVKLLRYLAVWSRWFWSVFRIHRVEVTLTSSPLDEEEEAKVANEKGFHVCDREKAVLS